MYKLNDIHNRNESFEITVCGCDKDGDRFIVLNGIRDRMSPKMITKLSVLVISLYFSPRKGKLNKNKYIFDHER